MKTDVYRILFLALALPVSFGAEIFVSPSGRSSGDGSRNQPLDLASALSKDSPARPGDTIWLRDGTYEGKFTSFLTGTSERPIIVRSHPGEWARIDSGVSDNRNNILQLRGAWTTYRDFEVMSSDTRRSTSISGSSPGDIRRGEGIQVLAPHTRLINLVVHDTAQGLSVWSEAPDTEVYGCLIYNNGWHGPDRGHGHGIYAQNETGQKHFQDNIIFDQFDKGIQVYGSSSSELRNFVIEGNTIFNNGVLSDGAASSNLALHGGESGPENIVIRNNAFYGTNFRGSIDLGGRGADDLLFQGNYVAHLARFRYWDDLIVTGNTFVRHSVLLELYTPAKLSGLEYTWDNNHYFSGEQRYSPFGLFVLAGVGSGLQVNSWEGLTGFDGNSDYERTLVADNRVFVRRNKYDEGRAHITVFNWKGNSSMDVAVEDVLRRGQTYEVRNAQNYFGSPVLRGTYGGGSLRIPLSDDSMARPVGISAPDSTAPEFHVFVLQATGEGSLPDSNENGGSDSNGAPTISSISSRTIPEGGEVEIDFTIGDPESSASDLGVIGSSSNTDLIPNDAIRFDGSGSQRSVTIRPVSDETGSAVITISVLDGVNITRRSFTCTVKSAAPNQAPVISRVEDFGSSGNSTSEAVSFEVSDSDNPADELIVVGSPSNPRQISPANIVIQGSGNRRTVTITPTAGQYGTTDITLSVSDGVLTSVTRFVFTSRP